MDNMTYNTQSVEDSTLPKFNLALLAGEDYSVWANRFYTLAGATGRLFRAPEPGLVHISRGGVITRLYDPIHFGRFLHTFIQPVRHREGRDGEDLYTCCSMSPTDSAILFHHSDNAPLPVLKALVYEPVAVPQADGSYSITKPGYNPSSGIYYLVPPGQMPITPLESTSHLAACFAGVPFETVGHRNNLLAWLLGAIVYEPTMDPPLLVVSGNQQGIGKTACVQAAGYILSGTVPSPIDFRGGEFMKSVGARFVENDRVMFLDNIVSRDAFDNTQLSTLLTQGFSKKIRLLGHNRTVSASGILFAASLNDARLSADLATRSLAIKLYREVCGPMAPFCRDYAQTYRREIYGELLGLAARAVPRNAPAEVHEGFRFRRWLSFVQPRIEPHFGPLAIGESTALDASLQEFCGYGLDFINEGTEFFTIAEFIAALDAHRDRYTALHDRFSHISSVHGRRIAIGRYIKSLLHRPLSSQQVRFRLVERRPGEGNQTRYSFAPDTDSENPTT